MSPELRHIEQEIIKLPKVELHAHLSGCFRAPILKGFLKIIGERGREPEDLITEYSEFLDKVNQSQPGDLDLEKCFIYFQILNFIIQVRFIMYDTFCDLSISPNSAI